MVKLTEKERNRQIRKEAIASAVMYVIFFLWWYFTGYGIAEASKPSEYTYVLGLPLWFFLSSIVGYIWFCVATVFLVKFYFKHFSLDEISDEEKK